MADAQTPVLTDEQIEAALQKAGGRWSGDYWVIEDADLHPFVRGVLAAQAPAQPMQPAEASWDRFIERLNTVQPPSKLTKHGHKNLLGSVAHYKAIFLAANADQSPAPSQSGRAVMQQALDAFTSLADCIDKMGEMPDSCVDPVMWRSLGCEEKLSGARAAIAALEKSLAP